MIADDYADIAARLRAISPGLMLEIDAAGLRDEVDLAVPASVCAAMARAAESCDRLRQDQEAMRERYERFWSGVQWTPEQAVQMQAPLPVAPLLCGNPRWTPEQADLMRAAVRAPLVAAPHPAFPPRAR